MCSAVPKGQWESGVQVFINYYYLLLIIIILIIIIIVIIVIIVTIIILRFITSVCQEIVQTVLGKD